MFEAMVRKWTIIFGAASMLLSCGLVKGLFCTCLRP